MSRKLFELIPYGDYAKEHTDLKHIKTCISGNILYALIPIEEEISNSQIENEAESYHSAKCEESYCTRQIVVDKEELKLLEEFINWAKNCGEDAFYIYEETEEAIIRFLNTKDL